MVAFNCLGVREVYIGYLWTRKIVLGLKDLSSFNITACMLHAALMPVVQYTSHQLLQHCVPSCSQISSNHNQGTRIEHAIL